MDYRCGASSDAIDTKPTGLTPQSIGVIFGSLRGYQPGRLVNGRNQQPPVAVVHKLNRGGYEHGALAPYFPQEQCGGRRGSIRPGIRPHTGLRPNPNSEDL